MFTACIGVTSTLLPQVCSKSCKERQSNTALTRHYIEFGFQLDPCGDLPLQAAIWTLALHFPDVVHLTSSLAPDKTNPWRQVSWQIVPGLAGCLPQLGGDTVTPLGFWKVAQWRSIAGEQENIICILTNYKMLQSHFTQEKYNRSACRRLHMTRNKHCIVNYAQPDSASREEPAYDTEQRYR